MSRYTYSRAVEKIPAVIGKLAAEHPIEGNPKYRLRIEHWHTSNVTGERIVHGIDNWFIDEDDLLDHMKKAKRLNDATITITDVYIIVERVNYSSTEGRTAIYTPEAA